MSKRLFLFFALAAFFALATVTRSAHAADSVPSEKPTNRWEARPGAVLGQVGFGTPTVLIGVTGEWSPSSWATLSGGVGLSQGVQIALMPRLRVPFTDGFGASLGVGVSGGEYAASSSFLYSSGKRHWTFAVWANVELGLEGRLAGGFTWRTFIGYGGVLNTGDGVCMSRREGNEQLTSGCGGWAREPHLPYLGAAFGYAF